MMLFMAEFKVNGLITNSFSPQTIYAML